eukprot:2770034-Prymnesium_polylepis.1
MKRWRASITLSHPSWRYLITRYVTHQVPNMEASMTTHAQAAWSSKPAAFESESRASPPDGRDDSSTVKEQPQ